MKAQKKPNKRIQCNTAAHRHDHAQCSIPSYVTVCNSVNLNGCIDFEVFKTRNTFPLFHQENTSLVGLVLNINSEVKKKKWHGKVEKGPLIEAGHRSHTHTHRERDTHPHTLPM